jgi:branched-chain amino acid aminotransferase
LAQKEGIRVIEKDLVRYDLYTCDELFLTGTAAEVIGVSDIDGRIIDQNGPGPITKLLREKFYEYAHKK